MRKEEKQICAQIYRFQTIKEKTEKCGRRKSLIKSSDFRRKNTKIFTTSAFFRSSKTYTAVNQHKRVSGKRIFPEFPPMHPPTALRWKAKIALEAVAEYVGGGCTTFQKSHTRPLKSPPPQTARNAHASPPPPPKRAHRAVKCSMRVCKTFLVCLIEHMKKVLHSRIPIRILCMMWTLRSALQQSGVAPL